MNSSPTLAQETVSAEALALPSTRSKRRWPVRALGFLFGWGWRILAGAALCFNFFVLSYLTSIAVLGWLMRWMQTSVVRGWWKQSRLGGVGTFQDFCASLDTASPSPRPRWLWRDRTPLPSGERGRGEGLFQRGLRLLTAPFASLVLNFKLGLQGLFCVYLVTGIGCLVMLMSWEYGWLNSFNRHYEQFYIGPAFGIFGSGLFILAMFYVPMAQAHQAVTGEARAFFHFRFVWSLIRARLTVYLGLALLTALASMIFEGLRLAVVSDNFPGNLETVTAAEGLDFLRRYLFFCSVGLFVTLLLLKAVTAAIYRSAVLKVLRQGTVRREELHPLLARWLEKLDLLPVPVAITPGLVRAVRATGGWGMRRVLFTGLFLVWMLFLVRFYIGYFLAANPYLAFLNHPLVQLPCIDFTPVDLAAEAQP